MHHFIINISFQIPSATSPPPSSQSVIHKKCYLFCKLLYYIRISFSTLFCISSTPVLHKIEPAKQNIEYEKKELPQAEYFQQNGSSFNNLQYFHMIRLSLITISFTDHSYINSLNQFTCSRMTFFEFHHL